MTVLYEQLPQRDRRAAERLAKKLLNTTPAAPRREFSGTMRDALDTAFLKAENVVAALVYDQGSGTWASDIVLRKGKYELQRGVSCDSQRQALSCLKRQIAQIKATCEHPLVADVRKMGVDPDNHLWLGVRHVQFGYRCVERRIDEIGSESLEFLRRHGIAEYMGEEGMRYAERLARDTVLLHAPEFATDDKFLSPPTGTDKSEDEIKLWLEAASFLLERGIFDIDDDVETDVIYERILRLPDQLLNIMWIANARNARNARTVSNEADIHRYLARIASTAAAAVRSKSKRGVDSNASAPPVPNKQKIGVERVWSDNEAIVPKTGREYVKNFRQRFKKWDASENCPNECGGSSILKFPDERRMRRTLEMCRVVYEARRSLSHWEFEDFCKEIGLTKRSAIRKFVAIGEACPWIILFMKKDADPIHWHVVDFFLRWPSGEFPPSDVLVEACHTASNGVRNIEADRKRKRTARS